ncbi:MAG: hypothetical protein HY859_05170 [Caulobacterales bacterium]|nr:hypothetical protein [Caulobacterales bacterium]
MAGFFNRFPRRQKGGELHIDATDARQASWGRHAFWMLICSTALVVVALFGAWAYRADDLSAADARSRPSVAEAQAAGELVR